LSCWTRPRRFERNLVVIGGGAGGLVTAYIAAAVKAKVTLVEQHKMGGDCLNTGCVPSKALISSAKCLSQIARAKEFGIHTAHAEFDFADVMERVQRVDAGDRAARLHRTLHPARRRCDRRVGPASSRRGKWRSHATTALPGD
jgi:pyruvate/2-oxoglutarate dehydrogenase complex dihydrolipoamide dehydrogenase (E3) component